MIYSEFGDSLLLRQFRDYYEEVIRLKRLAAERSAPQDISFGSPTLDINESPARFTYQQILSFLETQHRGALQLGNEYSTAYEEARYVMVVLADEIFLHLNWEGRYAWGFKLLEEELYQSRLAGETFFQRVDELLEKRDPVRVELAKIYLMAMALGFQGRYRGRNVEDLTAYRRRLYAYIFQSGLHLTEESIALFPETHRNTLDSGGPPKKLPPVRTWMVRLGVVVALALMLQWVIWHFVFTSDIRDVVDRILTPTHQE